MSNPKKCTQSSFWDGHYYAEHSFWQFHVAKIGLQYIQIPKNAKILDIGCGDGRLTKHLATMIPEGEIIGLDPSSSMLAAAKKHQLPNLSFIEGNAMNLPFKSRFDRIVAFNSLHWISEINVALRQIHQALAPGGRALILVVPVQSRHPIHQIINEVAKSDRWHAYFDDVDCVFSFRTSAEWAVCIEQSKLILENLQLIDASLDYINKKAFADWLVGWIPFGTIPKDAKHQYIQDVVEAYVAKIPCDPNGVVHFHLDELVIVASK